MSGIEVKLTTFTAPRKPNPFDGVVAQVAEAERDTAGEVTIPKEIALSTAQTKIREAAKDAKLKARIRKVDEEKRVITFTLHDKKTSTPDKGADDEAADVSAEG